MVQENLQFQNAAGMKAMPPLNVPGRPCLDCDPRIALPAAFVQRFALPTQKWTEIRVTVPTILRSSTKLTGAVFYRPGQAGFQATDPGNIESYSGGVDIMLPRAGSWYLFYNSASASDAPLEYIQLDALQSEPQHVERKNSSSFATTAIVTCLTANPTLLLAANHRRRGLSIINQGITPATQWVSVWVDNTVTTVVATQRGWTLIAVPPGSPRGEFNGAGKIFGEVHPDGQYLGEVWGQAFFANSPVQVIERV